MLNAIKRAEKTFFLEYNPLSGALASTEFEQQGISEYAICEFSFVLRLS